MGTIKLVLLFIFITLLSCQKKEGPRHCYPYIKISNNTDQEIYRVKISLADQICQESGLPQDSLEKTKEFIDIVTYEMISAKGKTDHYYVDMPAFSKTGCGSLQIAVQSKPTSKMDSVANSFRYYNFCTYNDSYVNYDVVQFSLNDSTSFTTSREEDKKYVAGFLLALSREKLPLFQRVF
ncbi:MAG: hypothetical protein NXI00_19965 [Cytophagales bacterium]|nr:hypothetical protein [Cytophagales bacterium]